MNILESLSKKFFKTPTPEYKTSQSLPHPENIELNLTIDNNDVPIGFFDGNPNDLNLNIFTHKEELERVMNAQKDCILAYRRVAQLPEVNQAISEIIDEATFSQGKEDTLSLDFGVDISNKLKEKINQEFDIIQSRLNLKKNLYSLFLKFYIDGQLNLHCSYNKNVTKSGITHIKVLEPFFFYYKKDENLWKYLKLKDETSWTAYTPLYYQDDIYSLEFDNEEVVHIDSGIYNEKLILSDLDPVIKIANMLQTLEEMLIPMRFSRSVSRRVFNIDVANMNSKKAEEFIKKLQDRFKYKKFYDVQSGTISNQQHIASLTEDYWFPNRNGSKGTTVDTIDETGNLGETGDIDYFRKKLYGSLKVPLNRLLGSDDKAEFDFTANNISKEEIKFFNFITRKRNQFSEMFFQLLKRQLVSKQIMSEKEFNDIVNDIKIVWNSENKFFEKMQDDIYNNAISMFNSFEELANKGWISKEFLYKKVLKFSQEEIDEIQNQIKKEKKDPVYKNIKVGDGFDDRDEDLEDKTDNQDDKKDIENQEPESDNLEQA